MRILIWSPNYAPESLGIPPLVTDAAEGLVAAGHSVEVVAPVPNYPERRIREPYRGLWWGSEVINRVRVWRHWLRVRPQESVADKAWYEISASLFALPHVLRRLRAADVLVVVLPTLSAVMVSSLLPRRPRLIVWVQDLVLPAAAAVQPGRVASALIKVAERGEMFAINRADVVVTCSPGFENYYRTRGVPQSRMALLYNWADVAAIDVAPPNQNGSTHYLYAGNLGYTQGLENLIEAARLAGNHVAVDIVGAGNAEDSVRRVAASVPNVHVRSAVPREEMPALLAAADVHVVIQRRVAAGVNLPSKIAPSLASGRPILAAIDPDTPAARLLSESGGAILVEPESPAAIAAAMARLADPVLRSRLGKQGRQFAERRLSKDAAIRQLERLLQ